MKMIDYSKTAPIALTGKLAVTYVDQNIDEKKGDNQEVGVYDFARPDKGVLRVTNDLLNQAEVEISPDGSKMLFTTRPKLDGFEDNSEIWQVNMDGTNPIRLTSGKPYGVPAWFPDGNKFTYITWGSQEQDSDSRLLTMDVSNKVEKFFPTNLRNQADPEVSYDGKLVIFKKPDESHRHDQPAIFIMNANGSGVRQLTKGWSDHDPVFSRDNKKVYFERYYGPGDWFEASQDRGVPEHNWWGIVEVDVASGKERVIIPYDPCGKHFFWLPTISPDGKSLMYVHIDVWAKVWTDLWVSNLDGENTQKVAGSDWFYFFDWSQ